MNITLSSIVGYLFGIVAVLLSLLFFFINVIAGIALLIAGLLALPVVRRILQSRLGLGFSRWAVVGLVGLLSTVTVVGLILGAVAGPSPAPGSSVSNITLSAASVTASNPITQLDVRWNGRAQSSVDPSPGDMTGYNSEDGQKFVVVRMLFENTGEQDIDLTPQLFGLVIDGAVYEYQGLFGSSAGGLAQVTLQPGGSYDGWVVYSVPEDATDGELVVTQDAYVGNVSVAFTSDSGLPVNVSTN